MEITTSHVGEGDITNSTNVIVTPPLVNDIQSTISEDTRVNQIERIVAIFKNPGDGLFDVPIFEVGSTYNPSPGETIPMGQARELGVCTVKEKYGGKHETSNTKES